MAKQKTPPTNELTGRLQAKELSILLKVSSALAASLDLKLVLKTAIENAVEVFHLDTGAVYILTDEILYLGATTPPLPEDYPDEFRTAPLINHPHIVQAVTSGNPVYIKDMLKEPLTIEEQLIAGKRSLRTAVSYTHLTLPTN